MLDPELPLDAIQTILVLILFVICLRITIKRHTVLWAYFFAMATFFLVARAMDWLEHVYQSPWQELLSMSQHVFVLFAVICAVLGVKELYDHILIEIMGGGR